MNHRKGKQPAGREQIGKCLGRTAKNISIILHLLLLLKMTVNQHIKLTNHIKRVLTPRVYIKHFTGYAGTSDNETFQNNTQTFLPASCLVFHTSPLKISTILSKTGRLGRRKLQTHDTGRTVKQESVTRHLAVMPVNTIKVTIE